MSPFRESAAPIIPEYLWGERWHQTFRCRLLGHSWQELFEIDSGKGSLPFPAFCSRCGRTRPEGRSHERYYAALTRYKAWLDRMVTGYG